MAKERKRRTGSRRKQFKREQRLQSARNWLASYQGNKIVKDYRRRYGVAWDIAFVELEVLGVPIDPGYKEHVLNAAASEAAARRHKKAERQAEQHQLLDFESDDHFAFIVGYTSGGAPYGVTWEEWAALEISEPEEEE